MSAMWTWANDGTVDISEANWSPANQVSQSNGVLTFDDPSRALAEIIKAQRGQASSFSGIIKAQQLGGQPPNHMWSEQILKREFSPTNTQHVSVLEIPRFGDLSLQHNLSVQQSPRPLPLSSSIHEISPLPDTGASPQAARMETFPLQQVPPQFAQQLPMHFMPQLHPPLLLSNPSSRIEQLQIRQAHAASYQHTHPALDKIQHNQQPSGMPDGPVRPPLSGINMTPQEKIEKLRWRQQIQAKLLAAEQKQQQLSNLSTSVGYEGFGTQHSADDPRNAQLDQILYNKQPRQQPLVIKLEEGAARASATHFLLQGSVEFKRNHAGIGGNEPISNDIDLHSTEKATHLDAALLHQLENAIMQLDMRTRLSMRDALYRLASSAMQRRSVNSSASGELPLHMSRFAGATTIETPTNPIDRTIANLLFYKQSFPSPRKQVHPFSTADASLPGSAPASGDSRLWAMQTPGSVALPNWGAPAQAFAIASTGQNVNLS
ncbi:hypothetical protein O6H91_19G061700 [Diphasiastrum complanatum]|uniref:Uncharacterized protein n=1 Tax=Diphasiastrum complanatum TaxID=34168 RepID=A0ACC2AWM0_DIPCM|nr:hypothetical protein O6H91_19G061700 [Diphasiastrum complanatum]